MKSCFNCKKTLDIKERPGRSETCPHCGADLHACLNCRFHDRTSSDECREPQAERVLEKDRANFCEYFEFRDSGSVNGGKDALKGLKTLFKDR